jgi:hypothetical protein
MGTPASEGDIDFAIDRGCNVRARSGEDFCMRYGLLLFHPTAGLALALVSIAGHAAQFVPPAGYLGKPTASAVASQAEPGAPALTRVPDASLSDRFHVDPSYPRNAHVKVVGAFTVAEPAGTRLLSVWSPGYLPLTLSFSDGRCFSLTADYIGRTLSNGRLSRTNCDDRRTINQPPAPPPPDRSLRLVGSSWGYNAWLKPGSHTTIITAPYAKTFEPLFTARMTTIAMMAMNGPDWPGGNVTLVGRVGGRLMAVTLDVGW